VCPGGCCLTGGEGRVRLSPEAEAIEDYLPTGCRSQCKPGTSPTSRMRRGWPRAASADQLFPARQRESKPGTVGAGATWACPCWADLHPATVAHFASTKAGATVTCRTQSAPDLTGPESPSATDHGTRGKAPNTGQIRTGRTCGLLLMKPGCGASRAGGTARHSSGNRVNRDASATSVSTRASGAPRQ